MFKKLFVVSLTLLLTGCTMTPGSTHSDVPGYHTIYLVFETHDAFDFQTNYVVDATIDVLLNDANSFAQFYDKNGVIQEFPAHYSAATPFEIPFMYSPTVPFTLTATGFITGEWGDAVICYFRNEFHEEIIGSRHVSAIFDTEKGTPQRSTTATTCIY